jgi:hypothetical protein
LQAIMHTHFIRNKFSYISVSNGFSNTYVSFSFKFCLKRLETMKQEICSCAQLFTACQVFYHQ